MLSGCPRAVGMELPVSTHTFTIEATTMGQQAAGVSTDFQL